MLAGSATPPLHRFNADPEVCDVCTVARPGLAWGIERILTLAVSAFVVCVVAPIVCCVTWKTGCVVK